MLRQAIASLPHKERAALVLRDIEGLSTAEVADILNSSETTVRSQISIARVKIRKAIERFQGGEP
jgi:RNA polymerase sigma-70 factor (ECF subfamily)